MFLTADADGRELCLRPDITIPLSCDYLASRKAGAPAGFCYLGPVFRDRGAAAPSEFLQAGIESFGRRDAAAADAEMLSLALEATAHFGLEQPEIRMGDVALFTALLAALDLPAAWKRRLAKDFNRKGRMAADLDRLARDAAMRPEYQGVLAALAGSDPKAAHALVTDLLSIAGITAVGGRSVDEIADRFLDQAALGATPTLPQQTRKLIERFLAIAGDPDEAAAELRALAKEAGSALDAALDLYESRIGFLAARGVDVGTIRFSTAFGRGLDYYSGFVFELHDPEQRVDGPLAGGGRYDALLTRLGSAAPIPAVGFAVWVERLLALGGEA
jgi:ATP phosphoribosyltransferase regulatory subunit